MTWNRLFHLLLLFIVPLVSSFPWSLHDSSSSESSDEENACARLYRQCLRQIPEKQPVCGTDGNTYDTICRLRYTNCWIYDVNIQLHKAYDGPCVTTTFQPVTNALTKAGPVFPGRPGAPGRPTAPGYPAPGPDRPVPTTQDPYYEPNQPRCNFICPDNRDNVLVCGSDGVTYLSECYLKWLNCRKNTSIRVAYPGPCTDFGTLPPPTVSQPPVVDGGAGAQPGVRPGTEPGPQPGDNLPRAAPSEGPTTTPRPPCQQYCPLVSEPVCGNDGNTYMSQCHLEVQACKSGRRILVAYTGVCDSTAPKTNNESKPCPRIESCPLIYLPVCGSNGRTYQSECHLLAEACTTNSNLRVVSVGECPELGTPNNCGACSQIWQPVCGFDNVTYYSECHLRQYACETNKFLRVAYRSVCKAGLIECPDYCPPGVNDPVCGTDGNTYPSLCFLSFAACINKDRKLTQKHRGECSLDPCERKCPTDTYQPVCSSTGDTYQNDCFLWVAMCRDSSVTRSDSTDVECNLAIP